MDVPTGDHLLRQPSGTSVTWWTCLQATIFLDNHQEPLWRDGRAYRRPSSETTIRNLCDVMEVSTCDHLLRQPSGTSVTWCDGDAYRRPSSETTIRNLCDVMDVPTGDHLLRQPSGTSVTWWTCLQATIFLDNHQEPLWCTGEMMWQPCCCNSQPKVSVCERTACTAGEAISSGWHDSVAEYKLFNLRWWEVLRLATDDIHCIHCRTLYTD